MADEEEQEPQFLFQSPEQVAGLIIMTFTLSLVGLAGFGMLEQPLSVGKLNTLMMAATTLLLGERLVTLRARN